MAQVHVIYYLCAILWFQISIGEVVFKRRCGDPNCTVAIGEAKTKVRYNADESFKVSFKSNTIVTVYSKDADTDLHLWGIEVDGERGYADSSLLVETRVFISDLKFEVPATFNFKNKKSSKKPKQIIVTKLDPSFLESNDDIKQKDFGTDAIQDNTNRPNSELKEQFSVIEGTTIYSNNTNYETEILGKATTSDPNVKPSVTIHPSTVDSTDTNNLQTVSKPSSGDVMYTDVENDLIKTVADEENLGFKENPDNMEKENSKEVKRDMHDVSSGIAHEIKGSAEEKSNGNMEQKSDGSMEQKSDRNKEQKSDGSMEQKSDRNKEQKSDGSMEYKSDGNKEQKSDGSMEQKSDRNKEQKRDGSMEQKSNGSTERKSDEYIEMTVGKQDEKQMKVTENERHGDEKDDGMESTEEEEEEEEEGDDYDEEEEEEEEEKEMIDGEDIKAEKNPVEEVEKRVENMNTQYVFPSSNTDDTVERNISDTSLENHTEINVPPEHSEELNYNNESTSEKYNKEEVPPIHHDIQSSPSPVSESLSQTLQPLMSADIEVSVDTKQSSEEQKEEVAGTTGAYAYLERASEIPVYGDGDSQQVDHMSNVEQTSVSDSGVTPSLLDSDSMDMLDSLSTEHSSTLQPVEDKEHSSTDFILISDTDDTKISRIENAVNEESVLSVLSEEEMSSNQVQDSCEAPFSGCTPDLEMLPTEDSDQEPVQLFNKESDNIMDFFTKTSFDLLSFLVVTAVTVLSFLLGHYYIERKRQDGLLISKISSLEKSLIISSQEKFTLKDELESTKEQLLTIRHSTVNSGTVLDTLQSELEETKAAKAEMEEQVISLEKELEAATEAGLELNRMMSELLSAQHGSDTLMKSVEQLQKQLDSQQSTITSMNDSLSAKNLENETLQSEMNLSLERIKNLEEQLQKANENVNNLQREKVEMEHDLQTKNKSIEEQLVEALKNKSVDSQRLCRELDALQDVLDETNKTLAARDGEVAVLRDCLNRVESLPAGEQTIALEALLDVGHLKAEIELLRKERNDLKEKLLGEEDARKLLEDHVKIVSEEVSVLRVKHKEAEHDKTEAQTRLEVLSNYFKEKETQMQKELGLQEAMCIQKQGDALAISEQIKKFQEEVDMYRARNEQLKLEIIDQEQSLKAQIAMHEKRAHDSWVAARKAERRLEESKQEASQLRNRLTMTGRNMVGAVPGPEIGKPVDRGNSEHNGDMSSPAHMNESQELPSSPLHYGLPGSPPLLPPAQALPPGPFPAPFPGMFLPPGGPGMPFPLHPPPGGLFPDDLRPPPLGRMSSPPPEPRGSYSPFEHTPPLSPPNRPYRSPGHYNDSPSRYRHQSPPLGPPSNAYLPGKWDDRGGPPRSSFRPVHRESPRESKGSTLNSGHSSESLDKASRRGSRV